MKQRTIFIFMLMVFLIGACGSCASIRGSGNVTTETRSVSDFNRVSLSGFGKLILTQGEEESLTVTADDNIMPYIKTEVRGETLYLGLNFPRFSRISPSQPIRFTLTVKNIAGLDISGSGSVEAGSIDTDQLKVDVSGSGDVRLDSLTTEKLKVDISGSGKVNLAGGGEVMEQDIVINGSGQYQAGKLRSQTVEVMVSGSSEATVWATDSLEVQIRGSGSVGYYGYPSIDSSSSGSGHLKSLGQR
jgi:hypothetical protein